MNRTIIFCTEKGRSGIRRKTPAIRSKEITYRLCKALRESLNVTPVLSTIELQGLPLRDRDLATLAKVCIPRTHPVIKVVV